MLLSYAKFTAAVILTISLLAGGAGIVTHQLLASKQGAPQAPSTTTHDPTPEQHAAKPQTAEAGDDRVAVSGCVLDPDGKPVAGATLYQAVHVPLIDGNPPPAPRIRGRSGPDGRFHFLVSKRDLEDVPNAVLQVVAVAEGFGPGWATLETPSQKEWTLQGDASSPLTVRLEAAGTVVGRLVDEDGQPRPRVELLIYFVRKDKDYLALHHPGRITTDREGRFRVEGLASAVVYQINLAGKPPHQTIGCVVPGVSTKAGETKDLGDVKARLAQE